MRCEQTGAMMSARLDNRLGEAGVLLLDEHMALCDSCLADWRALTALDRLLGTAPMMTAPTHLRLQVMARLDRRGQARQALVGSLTLALGTVALTLLLVAPLFPTLLGFRTALPALARGGPATVGQLLVLLETAGRTALVFVERFAVPLAAVLLFALAVMLALNGLCIRMLRHARTAR